MSETEMRNPNTMRIDRADTSEILQLIQDENYHAVRAIEAAMPSIREACDRIVERMKRGGRLIYIGAGTSGRLGVMDAAECPPTFGVSPDLISGIIAGGYERMVSAGESAEDNGEAGVRDLSCKHLTDRDTVLGISVAGNAAYVADALLYAKSLGCLTVGLSCNEGCRLDRECDISILTRTGAEVVTGSTRMKAGSAHKMVLNMISTCVMIRMGNVYENMMINLRPSNQKLRRRVLSIVRDIFLCDEEGALELMERYEWSIRAALEGEQK